MKLSDAVILGSTSIKLVPYEVLTDFEPRGCAIGAGLYALGYRCWDDIQERKMPQEWRWLNDKHDSKRLCACRIQSDLRLINGSNIGYLTHYFNEHVVQSHSGRKKITLDRLVEWIRSVEPISPVSTETEGRDPVCTEPAEMECRK